MIGRAGSKGFPGKNLKKILGRSLYEYSLVAAKKSKYIDRIFISSDCPTIIRGGKKYGATIIKRPRKLADSKALGEDVFRHGYFEILKNCLSLLPCYLKKLFNTYIKSYI